MDLANLGCRGQDSRRIVSALLDVAAAANFRLAASNIADTGVAMPRSGHSPAARPLLSRGAAIAVAAATLLLTAGGAVRPPGPAPASLSHGDPLRGIAAYLRTRIGSEQVAVYDRTTGRTYLLANGPRLPQYTASIVKADILAMWLWRYKTTPGTIPANVPYSIKYLMQAMITASDNAATTGLFHFAGGCTALTLFNTLIPTHGTKIGCETPTYYGWGNSTTTAADQVAIMRDFAYPNQVLPAAARKYGLQLMESVIPTQRWGVTCGPWGTVCDPPDYAKPVPGVTVALKNGWKYVPSCPPQDETCPWQINSIGSVQGKGRDYVIAVLTTNDPPVMGRSGMDYGITTVQGVSKLVWRNLATG
jgi:hypothetical protein